MNNNSICLIYFFNFAVINLKLKTFVLKATLYSLLIPFIYFITANGVLAQESVIGRNFMNDSYISWVKEFPSLQTDKVGSAKGEKFKNVVFGKKDIPTIDKPMNVVASNPDSFMVIDQANGLMFQIQNMSYDVPKHLRKKFSNFSSMVGICYFIDGGILFTDSHLNNIYMINKDKTELSSLNDSLDLMQPTGVAYSKATGEIWVVETTAHRISILNSNGKLLRRIGQRGNGNLEFNYPTFIWIDNAGTAYIVDALNFRIQIVDKNGYFVSSFGKIGDATGYLARPKGIATDSRGNIYVVDGLFNSVQIFDKSGIFLYNFGSQGRNEGEFWMPVGIFIDKKDFIYIADSYNSRVQIFQLKYDDKK